MTSEIDRFFVSDPTRYVCSMTSYVLPAHVKNVFSKYVGSDECEAEEWIRRCYSSEGPPPELPSTVRTAIEKALEQSGEISSLDFERVTALSICVSALVTDSVSRNEKLRFKHEALNVMCVTAARHYDLGPIASMGSLLVWVLNKATPNTGLNKMLVELVIGILWHTLAEARLRVSVDRLAADVEASMSQRGSEGVQSLWTGTLEYLRSRQDSIEDLKETISALAGL